MMNTTTTTTTSTTTTNMVLAPTRLLVFGLSLLVLLPVTTEAGRVMDVAWCTASSVEAFANDTVLTDARTAYAASEHWKYSVNNPYGTESVMAWGSTEKTTFQQACIGNTAATNQWIEAPDYKLICDYNVGEIVSIEEVNYGICVPKTEACNDLLEDENGKAVYVNYTLYEAMKQDGLECTGLTGGTIEYDVSSNAAILSPGASRTTTMLLTVAAILTAFVASPSDRRRLRSNDNDN